MENGLGNTNVWLITALVLGLLLGWFCGWLMTRARARADLQALESAKGDAERALDSTRNDLAKSDERFAEQENEKALLLKQKTGAEQSAEQLQNDVDDLTAKIELLESSQSESSDEIQALEDAIAGLESKLEADRLAHQAETAKLSAENNARISARDDELAALKRELNTAEETQAADENKLQGQQALISKLEAENARLTADRDALAQQLQAATAQIDDTSQALEEAERALQTHQQTSHASTSQLSYLEDQVRETKQLRDNLRGEISHLESSLSVWQNKHARSQEALRGAEQKNVALQQALEDSKQTDPSYERLLKIKDQEIRSQKEQAHVVQNRLLAAHEEVKVRELKINDLSSALEKLHNRDRRELASAAQKLAQQQTFQAEERHAHAAREESLQQEIARLEKRIDALARDLRQSRMELERAREEQREISQQLNETKTKLAEKNRESIEYAQRNDELGAQFSAQKLELARESQRYSELNKDRQAKINANQTLQSEIAQQFETIAALKEKLAATEKARPDTTQASAKPLKTDEPKPANLLKKKPAKSDDLKRISGVGPKLETMLNKLGIYQFAQIAEFKPKDVAWVDEHIDSFKGRIYRDEWVKQAKKLAKE